MSRNGPVLTFAVCILISGGAFAQNARSAVSSTGSDVNSCTVASPCRSFSTAIAHTNAGGEIIALDSAGYGPFTISSDMTVSGAPGVHAAITASGGADAIKVNGVGTHVVLRNLVLISAGGNFGVSQTAGDVYYANCVVLGFSTGI